MDIYSNIRDVLDINNTKNGMRKYIIIYSVVFAFTTTLCYFHFILNGKSLIWSLDGYGQHLTGLIYYAQWLRSIVRNLFKNHVLQIPTWSFSMGYGSDIPTILHFYVVGDPFAIFAIFVPTKYIPVYYEMTAILRLWCAGLTFSAFCFSKEKKLQAQGILAGAIVYAFSIYAMYNVVRHPDFVTPMVFLPLLLLGTDRIIQEKRPWLYIAMVFISAVSNFYFFYMLALITVMYSTLILFVPFSREAFRRNVKIVLRLFGYAIVGVMLSASILLPEIMLFASDQRVRTELLYDLIYPPQYYESFPSAFLSFHSGDSSNWMSLGYAAPVLVAIVLLYYGKNKSWERYRLRLAFAVLTAFLMIPFVQHVFNGFSYPSGRWHFGYSLLAGYILAYMWGEMLQISKKKAALLVGFAMLYFTFCVMFDRSRRANAFFALFLMLMTIVILVLFENHGSRIRIGNCILGITVFAIVGNALFGFSDRETDFVSYSLDRALINDYIHPTEARAIYELTDQSVWSRYSYLANNECTSSNSSLLYKLHSTGYWWSLQNYVIADFMEDQLVDSALTITYTDPDRRTILEAMASVRYAIINSDTDPQAVPYGFEQISEKTMKKAKGKDTYRIYENAYALPFGYTYSSLISEDKYNELTPLQKQEALLYGVVLEGYEETGEIKETLFVPSSRSMGYVLTCDSKEITQQGNSFVVTKPNSTVTLTFSGMEQSETYLYIKNMEFTGATDYQLYQGDDRFDPLDLYGGVKSDDEDWKDWNELSVMQQRKLKRDDRYYVEPTIQSITMAVTDSEDNTISREFSCETPKYTWYNGRKNYLLNLYYNDAPRKQITITFPQRGIYTFDDIQVLCQPMKDYGVRIQELKKEAVTIPDFHEVGPATNHVTCNVKVEMPKVLVFSVPWSEGWKAMVDGTEVKLYRANGMYMGIPLAAGEHVIELRYQTPGMRAGWIISAAGILGCFLIAVIRKLRDNSNVLAKVGNEETTAGYRSEKALTGK